MLEKKNTKFKWIVANASQGEDMTYLRDKLGIDSEILSYASDKNELSHLEYDRITGQLVVIYNVLDITKQDFHYQTSPMTFFVNQNQIVSIFNEKNAYIIEQLDHLFRKQEDLSLFQFLFIALFTISKNYFPTVESLNQERNRLNHLLRQRTSKKELLELSDLQTGLVYLVSASKQNTLLLNQLKSQPLMSKLTEDEKEQLEDAVIEARQLLEMTQLSSQVLGQLDDAYNNILNNELNDTMKILTLLSILLTVPDMVTGFFGINVPLPSILTKTPLGWLIVIGIAVVLWFVMAAILSFLMDYRRK